MKENSGKMSRRYWFLCLIILWCPVLLSFLEKESGAAGVDKQLVPEYVSAGLSAYKTRGYEAAVKTWLANSPYEDATTLASNLTFFRNFQMLAGKYLSADILMTNETQNSNLVYVRMNYERIPVYVLFTSFRSSNQWLLGKIQISRTQKYGAG
jgi:hypothetical protein